MSDIINIQLDSLIATYIISYSDLTIIKQKQFQHMFVKKIMNFKASMSKIPKVSQPQFWVRDQGKGLQGREPRESSGVTYNAHGSEKECEGMNLHTPSELPFWELESQWTFKSSKGDFKGQNPLV